MDKIVDFINLLLDAWRSQATDPGMQCVLALVLLRPGVRYRPQGLAAFLVAPRRRERWGDAGHLARQPAPGAWGLAAVRTIQGALCAARHPQRAERRLGGLAGLGPQPRRYPGARFRQLLEPSPHAHEMAVAGARDPSLRSRRQRADDVSRPRARNAGDVGLLHHSADLARPARRRNRLRRADPAAPQCLRSCRYRLGSWPPASADRLAALPPLAPRRCARGLWQEPRQRLSVLRLDVRHLSRAGAVRRALGRHRHTAQRRGTADAVAALEWARLATQQVVGLRTRIAGWLARDAGRRQVGLLNIDAAE